MRKNSPRFEQFIGLAFPTMVALRVIGAALSPFLFAHAPALLIALSPFLFHLVFVAPTLELFVYLPVALGIATLQSAIGFEFGSIYGQRALGWMLKRISLPPRHVDTLLRVVERLSIIAVFAVPGPILGVTAGVAGVNRRLFYILVAPAQAIWVTAAYFVGEALLEYIAVIRTFVIENALLLTAATVTVGLLRFLWSRRASVSAASSVVEIED